MWTKEFWKAAAARALHSVAQSALAMISTSMFLEEVNIQSVISASILAGVISILKSIVIGMPEVDDGTNQRDSGE